jgi:hypothetical protein
MPATGFDGGNSSSDDIDDDDDNDDKRNKETEIVTTHVLPNRKHDRQDSGSGSEASKRAKKGLPPTIDIADTELSILTRKSVSPIKNARHYAGLNMFIEDMPVTKLDTFTVGAHVMKCIHDKLFPNCKFFKNDEDIDQFVGFVFSEIGMNGNTLEDRFKRCGLWSAVRKTIKTRTCDHRQLCIDRWYIAAKSKFLSCFFVLKKKSILTIFFKIGQQTTKVKCLMPRK